MPNNLLEAIEAEDSVAKVLLRLVRDEREAQYAYNTALSETGDEDPCEACGWWHPVDDLYRKHLEVFEWLETAMDDYYQARQTVKELLGAHR